MIRPPTRPEYSYIARKSCGCVVAVTHDYQDGDTGQIIGKWVRMGLTIERVTHEYVKSGIDTWFDCRHETTQETMPL